MVLDERRASTVELSPWELRLRLGDGGETSQAVGVAESSEAVLAVGRSEAAEAVEAEGAADFPPSDGLRRRRSVSRPADLDLDGLFVLLHVSPAQSGTSS